MTGVVVVEAVLLVIVGFFAVGLLHSYVGLLHRVQRLESGDVALDTPTTRSRLTAPTGTERVGADIAGVTLDGQSIALAVTDVQHNTLLAFLSSGCKTCAGFWASVGRTVELTGSGRARLVIVTQGVEHESPSMLGSLASPELVDTVMSSAAWQHYEVPGSPYFVFVDGPTGLVRGEGTALGWDGVFDLMSLAEGDAIIATTVGDRPRKPASDAAREAAVDRELLRAGIMPGDPSLYPGGSDSERAGE